MYPKQLWLAASTLIAAAAVMPQVPNSKSNPNRNSAEETCTVSGMVVRRVDSSPLKGATVQFWSNENRDHKIVAKTAPDGRFELKNIPAGDYQVFVDRNGYAGQRYGQRKPNDPGATLILRPGQHLSDLLFKLARAGVITGRVFDEDGEPMSNVSVSAMRVMYGEGQKRFMPAASPIESNDLGEYRIFGLLPGRYYVSAEMPGHVVGDQQFSGKSANETSYTKIYYPGTTDAGKASSISVKEDEEIHSIDLMMRELPAYRVRGKVINLLAKREDKRLAMLFLTPLNQMEEWSTFGSQDRTRSDGTFEISSVIPGQYILTASSLSNEGSHSAQQEIDVANADVDGIVLTIGPGMTIPGKVTWDGKPSVSQDELTVTVRTAEPLLVAVLTRLSIRTGNSA